MKNLFIKICFILLLLNLSACSIDTLFNKAISYERSNANLELKISSLDFGDITYLENNAKSDSTIVLLHGFGGDKDNWNRFSVELNDKLHIIVLDLPGHGKSVSTKKLGYSIPHQAEMLNKFLISKKIKSVHIAGNSMGGAISLSFTELFPNKVKSLILIDALGMIETKSEFSKVIDNGGNPFFDICSEEKFSGLISYGMHQPPYIPGIFMDKLVTEKCARSEIEKVIYKDMMASADLTQAAKKIKTPTLIIWGRKDRILHIDNASLFHDTIKNSKLVILEEFGHVPLLEAPEETAESVLNFIKGID